MADDVFGVVPSDIAKELPGIFPAGFSATSLPSQDQVASIITTADTMIGLRIVNVTGDDPDPDDPIAAIAVRFIVEYTKALVMRIVYAGRTSSEVDAAAKPYADLAKQLLETIVVADAAASTVWGVGTVVRSS